LDGIGFVERRYPDHQFRRFDMAGVFFPSVGKYQRSHGLSMDL